MEKQCENFKEECRENEVSIWRKGPLVLRRIQSAVVCSNCESFLQIRVGDACFAHCLPYDEKTMDTEEGGGEKTGDCTGI